MGIQPFFFYDRDRAEPKVFVSTYIAILWLACSRLSVVEGKSEKSRQTMNY